MTVSNKHWNHIFETTADARLGWYEDDVSPTISLLAKLPHLKMAFLAGAGTSLLIDDLLHREYNLILNDISETALNKVKVRLAHKNESITWLCQDISQPMPCDIPLVDLWIDRAVLHFLTDEIQIKGYFQNLDALLKSGGFAIFAEFSKEGAPKCAGLTLHRYSIAELTERLGTGYELIKFFNHTYFNPNGNPRPYIYALYKKK